VKVLSVFEDYLATYGAFEIWEVFRQFFCHCPNLCLHVTSLGSITSTHWMPRTLVMELPKIQDCRADIVRAAKIKILAPQKLAKDCLSDVGFPPFLTKHKGMLVRFKRTLDNLLENNSSPTRASKVARHEGVPGMAVVDGSYSVAESLSSMSGRSFASSSTKKSDSSASTKPAQVGPSIRKSSTQLHRTMEAKAKENSLEDTAMSAATWLLATQKDKPKSERLDSTKVVQKINEEFKSTLNSSTVRRYVNLGHIGCGRLKRGPHGTVVDDDTYPILLEAYITHCQLLQANGRKEPNLKDLITQTKVVMNIEKRSAVESFVQNRLRSDAAATFKASKHFDQEARRITWTTFCNLNTWFDSFEKHCIELGFAHHEANGSIGFLHPERIFNLDETNVSLDGGSGNRGGRPTTTFYDPNLSRTGNAQSKTSDSCTVIFGSNALGQPLPPHFQLKTSAKIQERIKIRLDVLEHIPKICADYGDGRKEYSCTFGANEKGGMNTPEFMKYVENIRHIVTDCADISGKRIMLKVDSGPGRSDKEFLAWCRARGIIIYPGVPNTTAVSQEMDQSYGGFKTGFYVSLASLVEHRLKTASASGQPHMGAADYGMLIFGGMEGTFELPNLFERYFSIKKLKLFWEKVGAVPLTRNCLLSPQVRHEIVMNNGAIDLTADPQATHLATILVKNKEACDKLCNLGYKGNLFRIKLKIQEASTQPGRITAENSSERREALSKARTAGVHFKVTGGGPFDIR
jgi:hypothetical protein